MESENVKHALATLRVDQNVTKKVPAVVGRRRLEVLCSKFKRGKRREPMGCGANSSTRALEFKG
jgi:hypothetical protein